MASGEEIDSDWSIGSKSPRKALETLPQSAHDWEHERENQQILRKSPVYDDGTMTFFWYVHCCRYRSERSSMFITTVPEF